LRAGTENVVGIAGLGKAFDISVEKYGAIFCQIQEIKIMPLNNLQTKFQVFF
jgi:cysteine desulfurase